MLLRTLLLAACVAAPALALADASSDLSRARILMDDGDFASAKSLLDKVANSSSAPGNLRAEANLRYGCIVLSDQGGNTSTAQETARSRFRDALDLSPRAAMPPGYGSICEKTFAEVKGSYKPKPVEIVRGGGSVRPKDTPPPPPIVVQKGMSAEEIARMNKLEKERQELTAKIDAMSKQLDEVQKQNAAGQKATPPPDDASSGNGHATITVGDNSEQMKEMMDQLRQLRADLAVRNKEIDELKKPKAPVEFERRITVPTMVAGGVGVALLGAGTIFGVKAASDYGNFNDTVYQAQASTLAESGQSHQLTANILFGTAVVAAGTAVALYFLQGPPEPEAP